MGEPIPSASKKAEDAAAAAAADDEQQTALPTNAEDRKAAAALNSLNANAISTENGETSASKQPSAADQEALGKAMSRLEIATGGKAGSAGGKKDGSGVGAGGATEDKKKTAADLRREEAEAKRKIKVSAEDVNFLVEECDLTKVKATEWLRNYEGDLSKTITAFMQPAQASAIKA